MNGLNLKNMNASDMIDVLHYLFEDDMNYSSAEQADARGRSREIIYQDFYGHNYAYSSTRKQTNAGYSTGEQKFDISPEEESIKVFDPIKKAPKPFIPITNVNAASSKPFGAVLDEPLSK